MKSYTHFTLSERESLRELLAEGKSLRKIAKELGRNVSSVSRELQRNYSKKKKRYQPWRATVLYIMRRKHCRRSYVLKEESELLKFVNRGLQQYWSPEVISHRATMEGLSVSAGTIYRAIKAGRIANVSPKTHLRRKGKRYRKKGESTVIKPVHTIHDWPDIILSKERFGDFEGDTVCGAIGKGCAVTFVDRKSKLLVAGLASSRNSEVIRSAIEKAFRIAEVDLPVHSITLDNGSEFAAFLDIEKGLNTTIYFADPHSPWQRPLNENTNDILRFFFPKGTDFHKVSEDEFEQVVSLINNRPRKCLGFLSPLEFLSAKCCT